MMLLDCDEACFTSGLITTQVYVHKLTSALTHIGTSLSPLCRVTTDKTASPYIFWEDDPDDILT
jgi:hypothetical protein